MRNRIFDVRPVGAWVRRLRHHLGIPGVELARRLRVGDSFVSRVESGTRGMHPATEQRLKQTFLRLAPAWWWQKQLARRGLDPRTAEAIRWLFETPEQVAIRRSRARLSANQQELLRWHRLDHARAPVRARS